MIQQIIYTPRGWKWMLLLILLAWFKMEACPYDCHLSTPLSPWQNLGCWYTFLDCVRTDDPADNFRSKMVETDVIAHIVGFLQDWNLDVQLSSINAITTLVKFGMLIYVFGLQWVMIQQTICALRWWKQPSVLILLAFFKMGTWIYNYHQLKPSLL